MSVGEVAVVAREPADGDEVLRDVEATLGPVRDVVQGGPVDPASADAAASRVAFEDFLTYMMRDVVGSLGSHQREIDMVLHVSPEMLGALGPLPGRIGSVMGEYELSTLPGNVVLLRHVLCGKWWKSDTTESGLNLLVPSCVAMNHSPECEKDRMNFVRMATSP